MPVVVLLLVSTAAGLVAWRGADAALRTWWGRAPGTALATEVREHTAAGRFVQSRVDAEVVTGLALTVAMAAIVVAGTVVGVLALAVRRSDALISLDSAAARWAQANGGETSHRILEAITSLASTPGVILVGVVVGAIEWARVRSRWIPAFLIVLTVGDSIVTNLVKEAVDRARPTIDPLAATLGPS
ncbi:MAG: hypothetical protein ACRDQE_08990, partial [Gaiellales bacterium]